MPKPLNRVPSLHMGLQTRVDLTKKLPGSHKKQESKLDSRTFATMNETERLMNHTKKFLTIGSSNSQSSLSAPRSEKTPNLPNSHKAVVVLRQQVDVAHKNSDRAKIEMPLRTKSGNCSEQTAIFRALAAATNFNQRVATYRVLNPEYEGPHDTEHKKYADHRINVIGSPNEKGKLIVADTWPDFPFAELLKDSIWEIEIDSPEKVYNPGDKAVMTLGEMEEAHRNGMTQEEIDKIYFDDSYADPADSCAEDREEFLAGKHPVYLQLHSSKNIGQSYIDESNPSNKIEKSVDKNTFNERMSSLQNQSPKSPVVPYHINLIG